MPKHYTGVDVLTAARERISYVFDHADKVYLSFSGGKDSTVMLHLTADEARRRGKRFALLFIDLEAQYQLTIDHIERLYAEYADVCDPYWLALPLHLRNAVSMFEPHWICWESGREDDWVRKPPKLAITDPAHFPWFRAGMEFEELVLDFGEWYSEGNQTTFCLVGIRADESLNRFRTIASRSKEPFRGQQWTTWKGGGVFNAYPIYDWRTEDIWTYHGKFPDRAYNPLYERMRLAGLTIHQQRICQPYGDDQRKGLWLYQIIEPDRWARVLARVNGANSGALYVRERGNILGQYKVTLPPGHTWESFAELLISTMPPLTQEHYRNKIAVFLKWWMDRGFEHGIPDAADAKAEADKSAPSWRRICKSLLRNDYWMKGLSFTQTQSNAYQRYLRVMKSRRQQWGILDSSNSAGISQPSKLDGAWRR